MVVLVDADDRVDVNMEDEHQKVGKVVVSWLFVRFPCG